MRALTALLSLTPAVVLSAGCASKTISTQTLLTEMTDLADLAEFPDPPYTCRQFSSYDRKSVSPEEDWFANGDCGQYLRTEEHDGRTEYVMMDADGPGAIVRIWSANPKGTLRIYLDHNDTPVIETPMADLLGGKYPGIPEPLAGTRSRGWNLYFPIPYAKHCKVTSDEGGFYYHVNYRTYPRGTRVQSFALAELEELESDVQAVAGRLKEPREAGVDPMRWFDQAYKEHVEAGRNWETRWGPGSNLKPGKSCQWESQTKRPSAVVGLVVKVAADDLGAALRQLIMTMSFDGEQTVACPLGDFFGAAPGINAYESLPLGITADGEMWCHWVMPYRESSTLEIRNTGNQTVNVRHKFALAERGWTDRSMHFHARWRTEFDVPTRPMQDWNYVDIKGRGVFVGAAFSIANPVKNWWGEGDEKIYVDGETFPSHFGTGTEDYYGYAWCCNAPFMHAYHGQPRCDGPGNYGHTSVYRWHILDRIPFRKSLRFDMELWHWHDKIRVQQMSVVTYWYARPGATSNREPIRPDDLRVVEIPPYVPPRVDGALEGEEMRILEGPGLPAPQGIGPCSNEQHLWWREARPGDRLVLEFAAPQAGRYRVYGRFVKAADYGIVQLSVNGATAGEPLDFYNDGVIASDEIPLGEFSLSAGENRLTAEIVGANERAVKKYMFGLDYLRLEPVR